MRTTFLTHAIVLFAFTLLLCTSGCIGYWEDVNKLEDENYELADQLKWQQREQQMKAQKAKEAESAESADPAFKPSDY